MIVKILSNRYMCIMQKINILYKNAVTSYIVIPKLLLHKKIKDQFAEMRDAFVKQAFNADDSKIFFCYDNLMNTPRLLQDDLDNMVLWANDWSLELNLSKCKVMHFGKKTRNSLILCSIKT